jgi:hypothetical protein
MSDFMALLDRINGAGYGYTSEWVGEGENKIAKFTLTKGTARPRKVAEFWGAKPSEAAEKAAESIGVGDQMQLPL